MVAPARTLLALALSLCGLVAGCGGSGSSSTTAGARSLLGSPTASGSSHDRGARPRQRPSRSPQRGHRATGGAHAPPHAPPRHAQIKALPAPPPHTPQQRHNYADVVATVKAVVAGIAAHDPSICSGLFSEHYVESITGQKGAAGLSSCRQQIGAFRPKLSFVRTGQVRGNDRAAIVQYTTTLNGKTTTQILQLVRVGNGWKVYAALRRVK